MSFLSDLITGLLARMARVVPMAPPPSRWTRPPSYCDLPEEVTRHIQNTGTCPYCASEMFEGPQGGLSINLFCGNPACNSRFNVAPGMPWGQFTGECPKDFLDMRRVQIGVEAVKEGRETGVRQ